jgi:hypothetical protein
VTTIHDDGIQPEGEDRPQIGDDDLDHRWHATHSSSRRQAAGSCQHRALSSEHSSE